ncbi:hypothetical protein LEQ41_11640 [Streptococcus agalactiae]|nr:hypothetical protein [Streptococcus agalactiae]
MCTMNYNREGFVKKKLVFPGSSCSFFGSHTMRMPGRNILVSLLGEHIQWVWEADVLIQGGFHSRISAFHS